VSAQDVLKARRAARQAACQTVHDKMVARLVEYSPCNALTIADALYIARTAQALAFEATLEADPS